MNHSNNPQTTQTTLLNGNISILKRADICMMIITFYHFFDEPVPALFNLCQFPGFLSLSIFNLGPSLHLQWYHVEYICHVDLVILDNSDIDHCFDASIWLISYCFLIDGACYTDGGLSIGECSCAVDVMVDVLILYAVLNIQSLPVLCLCRRVYYQGSFAPLTENY